MRAVHSSTRPDPGRRQEARLHLDVGGEHLAPGARRVRDGRRAHGRVGHRPEEPALDDAGRIGEPLVGPHPPHRAPGLGLVDARHAERELAVRGHLDARVGHRATIAPTGPGGAGDGRAWSHPGPDRRYWGMAIDAHDGSGAGRPGGRGHRGLDRRRPLPRVLGRRRPGRLRRHPPGAPRAVPGEPARAARAPASSRSTCPPPSASRYPATSPALLAAFVVLDPGDTLTTPPDATSELYYCLEGSGSHQFVRHRTPAASARLAADRPVGPRRRRRRCPPGAPAEHTAAATARALLYRVTDAPLLAYLGVAPGAARFAPTRYDAGHLAGPAWPRSSAIPTPPAATGSAILLGNAAQPQTLTVTHTLWAMLGVLPADRVQRPHRHQSVALDLITAAHPGCYTLVGAEVDDTGRIVDPVRVDWESAGAFVTPPGLWHSHHNESGRPAYLVPDPGRRPPHLPAVARHPVHPVGRLTPVEFASALSRHPVTSQAPGEVARGRARAGRRTARPGGGDRHPAPRRRPRGRRRRRRRRAPPAGPARLRRRVGGRRGVPRSRSCPAISLWAGRVGPARRRSHCRPPAWATTTWRFDGWPDGVGFAPSAAAGPGRPVHLPDGRVRCADLDSRPSRASPSSAATPRGRRAPVAPGWPWATGCVDHGAVAVLLGPGHRGGPGGVPGLPPLRAAPDGHRGRAEPRPRDRRPPGHGVHGRPDRRAPRTGRHRRHRGQRPPPRPLRRHPGPRPRPGATSSSARCVGVERATGRAGGRGPGAARQHGAVRPARRRHRRGRPGGRPGRATTPTPPCSSPATDGAPGSSTWPTTTPPPSAGRSGPSRSAGCSRRVSSARSAAAISCTASPPRWPCSGSVDRALRTSTAAVHGR